MKNRLSGDSLQDWNLIALRQLRGSKHISEIDSKVRGMLLALGERKSMLDSPCANDRRTRLQRNLEVARSAAKKQGLLDNPKRGHWQLTAKGRSVALDVIRTSKKSELATIDRYYRSQTENLAINELARRIHAAIIRSPLLKKYGIPLAELEQLLRTWFRNRKRTVTVDSKRHHEDLMEVEQKAVEYIQSKEREWHTTQVGNKGFDLFKTQDGCASGKKTAWCEVKSLSGQFRSVRVTRSEIEEALRRGDAYWLYIVENVGEQRPNIIRIRNPARRRGVTFSFGEGWRHEAE